MTLYRYRYSPVEDWYSEASLREKLTDRGWVKHEECGGSGGIDHGGGIDPWNGPRDVEPCYGCVEGLVPPGDQVEAAAEAEWNALGEYETWDDLPVDGQLRPHFLRAARAALVAAARKEPK